jgi:3-dehydrotetronate 4-kinase
MALLFGAVADDDTGATDLAGMLAEAGVPALLCIGSPEPDDLQRWGSEVDAIVIATGSRALPAAASAARTREALLALQRLSPRMLQLKYCSTFDSTDQGNIGTDMDVALELLGEDFTIALPALPVNGRTTCHGHHFVHGVLLSESPMRDHPLNPMRDANLLRVLAKQTKRKVGLTPFPVIEQGSIAVMEHWERACAAGDGVHIIDCLHEKHLATVAEAACNLRLTTGSSALGMAMPEFWRKRGWLGAQRAVSLPLPPSSHGALLVAGSCSVATAAQCDHFAAQGHCVVLLDPVELLEDPEAAVLLREHAVKELRSGRPVLLRLLNTKLDQERTWQWGQQRQLNPATTGLQLAAALARFTHTIIAACLPCGLLSAGGETSSALCRELGLAALRVGRNIQPGVPLCLSRGRYELPIVLKSGNFGGVDFFSLALQRFMK